MNNNTRESWDNAWKRMCSDSSVVDEYRKAFLLNIFQKICSKMDKDIEYKKHIHKLFLQSFSKFDTTKGIIYSVTNLSLEDEDIRIIEKWFDAYRRKSNSRKTISTIRKEELYKKQKGVCVVCGNELGQDWSKIHVDHIIPWKLVGDELEDNYQLLCNTCNECKSAKTDYIFKSLIKLV